MMGIDYMALYAALKYIIFITIITNIVIIILTAWLVFSYIIYKYIYILL